MVWLILNTTNLALVDTPPRLVWGVLEFLPPTVVFLIEIEAVDPAHKPLVQISAQVFSTHDLTCPHHITRITHTVVTRPVEQVHVGLVYRSLTSVRILRSAQGSKYTIDE